MKLPVATAMLLAILLAPPALYTGDSGYSQEHGR